MIADWSFNIYHNKQITKVSKRFCPERHQTRLLNDVLQKERETSFFTSTITLDTMSKQDYPNILKKVKKQKQIPSKTKNN